MKSLSIWLALGAAGIALLLTLRFEGDSWILVQNAHNLLACWRAGSLGACPEAGFFPPLQLIPALLSTAVGAPRQSTMALLGALSAACFLGTVLLTHRALGRLSPRLAGLGLLALLSGPLLYYANSTFGEMTAASLTLWFVFCCLTSKPPLAIAASLFLAGLSKETAPILLLAVGLAVLERKRWLSLILGFLSSSAAHAGLNLMRFGVPYNAGYWRPDFLVTDLGLRVNYFFGLWLSPNGGLLLLWPVCGALLALSMKRWSARLEDRPVLVGVLLLPVVSAGLSGWFSPMGWVSWGPRLLLPWVPATLLLILHSRGRDVLEAIDKLSTRTYWTLVSLILLPTMANVSLCFWPDFLENLFPIPAPPDIPVDLHQDPAMFHRVQRFHLWPPFPAWLRLYLPWTRPIIFLLALASYVGLLRLASSVRAPAGDAVTSP